MFFLMNDQNDFFTFEFRGNGIREQGDVTILCEVLQIIFKNGHQFQFQFRMHCYCAEIQICIINMSMS